jgi:hypothetical protein
LHLVFQLLPQPHHAAAAAAAAPLQNVTSRRFTITVLSRVTPHWQPVQKWEEQCTAGTTR